MYDSREDTLEHIRQVGELIEKLKMALCYRKAEHDYSKLIEPEKSIFDKYTPKLAESTYGSKEYKEFLREMKPALDHHYANNRHHPEHFKNSIKDMTLVDLCEMIADWKAATLRHNNGDIMKSIEINQKRFGYSDELKQILLNTVKEYFA
jgi:hypothetical protein